MAGAALTVTWWIAAGHVGAAVRGSAVPVCAAGLHGIGRTAIVHMSEHERETRPSEGPAPAMDPVIGPVVRLMRSVGLLRDGDDEWVGEPLSWAEEDSLAQRLSVATQRWALPVKLWIVERAAGVYDAAEEDERLERLARASGCVVFAFSACPFCRRARETLDAAGAHYTVYNLDEEPWGPPLRARLGRLTSRTSLPSIWMGGECIGGLNDGTPGLRTLEATGELSTRLRACGALGGSTP